MWLIEALKWVGLALLVVSLLQNSIHLLRLYGIASTLCLLVGYYDDIVLIIIHVIIISIYAHKMYGDQMTLQDYYRLFNRSYQ